MNLADTPCIDEDEMNLIDTMYWKIWGDVCRCVGSDDVIVADMKVESIEYVATCVSKGMLGCMSGCQQHKFHGRRYVENIDQDLSDICIDNDSSNFVGVLATEC
jgi:hypothetical protein